MTRLDRFFFAYRCYPIRLGQVRQLWPYTRANAGYVPLARKPSKGNRAGGLNCDDLNCWEFLMEPFGNTAQRTGRARPDKDPIDLIELAGDLGGRLLGVDVFVGCVRVLIEPACVRICLEYLFDLFDPASEISARAVSISYNHE